MPKATKTKSSRVQVKELPKQEKELSSRDKKKVKGGSTGAIDGRLAINAVDGSVKPPGTGASAVVSLGKLG